MAIKPILNVSISDPPSVPSDSDNAGNSPEVPIDNIPQDDQQLPWGFIFKAFAALAGLTAAQWALQTRKAKESDEAIRGRVQQKAGELLPQLVRPETLTVFMAAIADYVKEETVFAHELDTLRDPTTKKASDQFFKNVAFRFFQENPETWQGLIGETNALVSQETLKGFMPERLPSGVFVFASGAPVQAVIASLSSWDALTTCDDGFIFLKKFAPGKGSEKFVEVLFPKSETIVAIMESSRRQIVDGQLATQILIILCSVITIPADPMMREMHILGSDLVNKLSLGCRKDLTLEEKLSCLEPALRILEDIRIYVFWKKGATDFMVASHRMWQINTEMHFKHRRGRNQLGEIYISFKAGKWAERFLCSKVSQDAEHRRQVNTIHEDALKINAYQNLLGARMAVYLTKRFREQWEFKVGALLEKCLSPSELRKGVNTADGRYRLKEQFFKALLTLKEIGYTIQFPEGYPSHLLPDWMTPEREIPPRFSRNYFDKWWNSRIVIVQPGDTRGTSKPKRKRSFRR